MRGGTSTATFFLSEGGRKGGGEREGERGRGREGERGRGREGGGEREGREGG